MSGHRIPFDLFAQQNKSIKDPGSGGTIRVERDLGHVTLVSAGAEARTLAAPTQANLHLLLYGKTVAGTITLTVTGGMDEDGTTSGTFTAAGQFAEFVSVEDGSNYRWRFVGGNGFTGPADVQGSLSLTGTLAVTGASTLTGAVTAAALITGSAGIVAKSATAAAITEARTLTSADSGGCFSVAKTSAYAITLPTPAQGLRFRFMVLDTGANAVTISDSAAHLFGAVSVNNVSTAMSGTTLSLASGGSVGDWVEFEGIDATHYLVSGACIAAADITIA